MELIDQIVEGEYTTNVYDNGTEETFLTAFPPKVVQPPVLTEQQAVELEIMTNTEMLLAYMELGGI